MEYAIRKLDVCNPYTNIRLIILSKFGMKQ